MAAALLPLDLLYDGHCRFCTQSAKKLARRFGKERVRTVNFQEEGVLARYPALTHDACMKKMHVVEPGGRVFRGAGAVARLFRTLRFIGVLFYVYYLPGLRQLLELAYGLVAKYRYTLFGKTQFEPGGTCHLHG